MKLSELLAGYAAVEQDVMLQCITADSRAVKPGDAFFACKGHQTDGRQYIEQAIQQGAAAVIAEMDEQPIAKQAVPIISISNLSQQLGFLAARFYGNPSRHMQIIGVTGTSGKTSCVQLLTYALSQLGISCGYIGTLGYGLNNKHNETKHTTPDAVNLQRMLAELQSQGAKAVAMEVSSHALMQGRLQGVHFDIGVFTNLSHEHLDYHGDMESYAAAKYRLFNMPEMQTAIINADDHYGRQWLKQLPANLKVYAYTTSPKVVMDNIPLLAAHDSKLSLHGIEAGLSTPWGQGKLRSRLLGRFNLSNLLAVLAVLGAMDIDLQEALAAVADLPEVCGRMNCMGGGDKPLVVVDYAHKPDALAKVLQILREHCQGKLWCVFGCGGERDRAKRPLMGEIAERFAEYIVLTNDNPRGEDPSEIMAEIQQGITKAAWVKVEPDRGKAIAYAIQQAQPSDIVLIAGKGHEDYQIIGDKKLAFSDIEFVKNIINEAKDTVSKEA